MEKKKTHKLLGNFELSFTIYAISCTENQIKTAWNINRAIGINLRDTNSPIPTSSPEDLFPVFSDKESTINLTFNLIANKTQKSLLVKELPNIDFLLEIIGDPGKKEKEEYVKKLKKIQGINAVIEVNTEKIKQKTPFSSI